MGYYVNRGRKGYITRAGTAGAWYRRGDGSTVSGTFAFHPHEGACFAVAEADMFFEGRELVIKPGPRTSPGMISQGQVIPTIVDGKRSTIITEGMTFTIDGKEYDVEIDPNHNINFFPKA